MTTITNSQLTQDQKTSEIESPVPPKFDLWKSIQTIIELQNKTPRLEVFSLDRESIPMSFNQERLWMLTQLNSHGSAYSIPFVFRIRGVLDRSILEKALQVLVNRHESLRSRIEHTTDLTTQIVDPCLDENKVLHCIDLYSNDKPIQAAAELEFIKAELRNPFNLNTGPLFRAKLLILGHEEHILILNIHHIIFDGWSEGILFDEISTIYAALSAQQELSLAPLSIQYADFSIWQRQCLQGDFLEVLKTYWRNVLYGKIERLALPTDYPSPLEPARGSAVEKIHFPQELVSDLKTLARQERATLFQALLAAFKVLLYHYTDQSDLCVCTPIANRNRNELKGLIGYFVNILILRTHLDVSLSFRQLLDRVKQTVSGASAYQDLPVQELATCFEGDQAVLSQVLFALQNTPQKQLVLPGLDAERLEVDNGQADFDLFLSLTVDAGEIKGALKYNTDLFKASSIELMRERYEQILTAAIANPDTSIHELLPLELSERQRLANLRHHEPTSLSEGEIRAYVAPRNEMEEKLATLWQEVLNLEQIGIHDNFFELGGRSLVAAQLLTQVENIFNQNIPLGKIFQVATIEKMALFLNSEDLGGEVIEDKPTTIIPFNSGGHRPPLFCVHSIEPGILHYMNIAKHLDRDQPFYGIQPPSLSGDERYIFKSIEEMAAYYVDEIITHQSKGPYFLTGHSMGGVIAYEIACQLEKQGRSVAFLGLLDTYAPGHQVLGKKNTPPLAYQIYIHLFNLSRVRLRRKLGYILEKIKRVIPKFIWDNLDKSAVLITDDFRNDLPEIYKNLPIYKAIQKSHYQAYKGYTPNYHYQGPLTLFRAIERPTSLRYKPCLGWSSVAQAEIKIYETPGHHNSMVHEPYVQALAQQIQTSLKASA
jgi:thioesterase domain-containing protein/NRPS condensation-like uncharacterized protein/acyl carrier protein